MRHGLGIYYHSNGEIEEAEFKEGKNHGIIVEYDNESILWSVKYEEKFHGPYIEQIKATGMKKYGLFENGAAREFTSEETLQIF